MTWARRETIERLFHEACRMPVVDSHTHVQDDLTGFDRKLASENLAGTQASVNAYPSHVIRSGLKQKRLVRRTMVDVAHGCFYSWFAEVVEGRRGRLDEIIAVLGRNSQKERKKVGALLIEELQDSRYTEYAEWLRFMFRLYEGVGDLDPLDPVNYRFAEACRPDRRQSELPGSVRVQGYPACPQPIFRPDAHQRGSQQQILLDHRDCTGLQI